MQMSKNEKEARLTIIKVYVVSLILTFLPHGTFLSLIIAFFLAPNFWIEIIGPQYDIGFYAIVPFFVDMYVISFGMKREWSLTKLYSLIAVFHAMIFGLNIVLYITFGEAI